MEGAAQKALLLLAQQFWTVTQRLWTSVSPSEKWYSSWHFRVVAKIRNDACKSRSTLAGAAGISVDVGRILFTHLFHI